MAVDYDLVVIGATTAGIQAAIAAADLKARVALVTHGCTPVTGWDLALLQARRAIAGDGQAVGALKPGLGWPKAAIANLEALHSPAVLAHRGIDVITGMGEFCRKPVPALLAEGRQLRSRAYLLAVGCGSQIPAIAGLDTITYLTLEQVLEQGPTVPPTYHWGIWGTDLRAIALAQALRQWGFPVTLFWAQTADPVGGDRDVAGMLQAQMDAAGIAVCISPVCQVGAQGEQTQIRLETRTLTVDRLVVVGAPLPNVAALNLAAMGIEGEPHRLHQSARLQTTNPRVYACLGQTEAGAFDHVACYEAAIAVKNALFWPRFRANYQALPFSFPTVPELAWVGLSEAQAHQQYGADAHVLCRSFNTLPAAQLRSDLTGWCKLMVRSNGQLLGAIVIGQEAAQIVTLVAFAMQQNRTIQTLATLPIPTPAIAQILNQLGQDWRSLSLARQSRREDWLDTFFDWRRSWSR